LAADRQCSAQFSQITITPAQAGTEYAAQQGDVMRHDLQIFAACIIIGQERRAVSAKIERF
jgi:hypothetical protein